MPFEVKMEDDRMVLTVKGRLGVRDAGNLWSALRFGADADRGVLLDAEELEEMDTSIVQILCRLDGKAGRVTIVRASQGFLQSLQRRGLEVFFAPCEPNMRPQPMRFDRRKSQGRRSTKKAPEARAFEEQGNG